MSLYWQICALECCAFFKLPYDMRDNTTDRTFQLGGRHLRIKTHFPFFEQSALTEQISGSEERYCDSAVAMECDSERDAQRAASTMSPKHTRHSFYFVLSR